MSKKRVFSELRNKIPEKLKELNLHNSYVFCEDGGELIPNEIIVLNKKNIIEFKFLLDNSYPFKPPRILIYNYDKFDNYIGNEFYDKWSHKLINFNKNNTYTRDNENYHARRKKYINAFIFTIIKNPTLYKYWNNIDFKINSCLCCESMTCQNKWAPNILMADLLGEYITRKYFKTFSSDLSNRIIKKIFNNDYWVYLMKLLFIFCHF